MNAQGLAIEGKRLERPALGTTRTMTGGQTMKTRKGQKTWMVLAVFIAVLLAAAVPAALAGGSKSGPEPGSGCNPDPLIQFEYVHPFFEGTINGYKDGDYIYFYTDYPLDQRGKGCCYIFIPQDAGVYLAGDLPEHAKDIKGWCSVEMANYVFYTDGVPCKEVGVGYEVVRAHNLQYTSPTSFTVELVIAPLQMIEPQ
jgi:hypothetical protein